LHWVIIAAGLPASLAAAEARLSGRVTDESQAPVAGARVFVHAGTSGWETLTDVTGEFRLKLPAPGEYRVTVERQGFFSVRNQAVRVDDDGSSVQLELTPVREVFETVEVRADAQAVEMDRAVSPQKVSGTDLLNVPYPTTNDLKRGLRIVPGVVQDSRGGLHVNGAAEDQVQYLLNGFNIADPLTGKFESRLSVEAVQSVDMASGLVGAEYGKGSAGALSVHTRSGDDKFRYSATNFFPGFEWRKSLVIGNWTPRFNVSGPVKPGRAWFFNGSDIQYTQHVVKELPLGEDRTSSWRFSNLLNTQVNVTDANILRGGWLLSGWTAPRQGLTAIDPWETTVDRRSRQSFAYIKDQLYLARRMLVEIGYAANRTFGREIPQGHDYLRITPGGKRGNYFVDAMRQAGRDQVLASVVLPEFQAAGEHQMKSGFDLNRVFYQQDISRTGFETLREDGTISRRTIFGGSGVLRRTNYEEALYLQDSWRPRSSVLIELGLRGDHDQLTHNWAVSPRIGLAWSLPWWERTKLFAGWGRMYDATSIRLFTRPFDQYSLTTYFQPNGAIGRGPALALYSIDDPQFPRPEYHTFNAGVERAWSRNIHTRFNYTGRRGRNGFTYSNRIHGDESLPPEWRGWNGANAFDALYVLGNGRRDIYDGFEVTVRQAFRGGYEWLTSYTRSRALSNAVSDVSLDDPILVSDNAGPMPWDAPNRLISWGYLPVPWRSWAVAYMADWRTGFPFSIQDDIGRVQGSVNSVRFPDYFELNLHLERRFLFRRYRWAPFRSQQRDQSSQPRHSDQQLSVLAVHGLLRRSGPGLCAAAAVAGTDLGLSI
jgi:hypothetical protein